MPTKRRYHLISLGCPKNLVDSAGMAALLDGAGYQPSDTPAEADLLIVNTCGFIEPARAESLQVLRELAANKRPGQRIVAAGCYSQRSPDELAMAVPEIDGLIGTRRWMDTPELVRQLEEAETRLPVRLKRCAEAASQSPPGMPRVAVQGGSAYLKIADGCRRSCTFCAIPLIKGTAVSRPAAEIVEDARWLVDHGVQEIILIAQDTTDYARDLGREHGLAELLELLAQRVPETPWIRTMYAFPGSVTDRLIETMAGTAQVLPYIDLPIQHAHPDVLRRMGRPASVDAIRRTLTKLRDAMPQVAIRTTLLTGFPGETEEEFEALLAFAAEQQFDRVGVFTYSHEEGTAAGRLEDDVPQEVKEERRERVMQLQLGISLARNEAFVGRTLDVLIEGRGDGLSVGRSYRDAPEIDGLVLVDGDLPVGEIVPITITGALEHDLLGRPDPDR
jgi:ribosomal protein S12 methylthiotransferase